LALRIGTGVSAIEEIPVELKRVRVATMSTDLLHHDLLTVESAGVTILDVKVIQDFIGKFKN